MLFCHLLICRGLLAVRSVEEVSGPQAAGLLLHTNHDAEPKVAREKAFPSPESSTLSTAKPKRSPRTSTCQNATLFDTGPTTGVFTSRLKIGVTRCLPSCRSDDEIQATRTEKILNRKSEQAAELWRKYREMRWRCLSEVWSWIYNQLQTLFALSLSFTEASTAVVKGVRAAGRGQ